MDVQEEPTEVPAAVEDEEELVPKKRTARKRKFEELEDDEEYAHVTLILFQYFRSFDKLAALLATAFQQEAKVDGRYCQGDTSRNC